MFADTSAHLNNQIHLHCPICCMEEAARFQDHRMDACESHGKRQGPGCLHTPDKVERWLDVDSAITSKRNHNYTFRASPKYGKKAWPALQVPASRASDEAGHTPSVLVHNAESMDDEKHGTFSSWPADHLLIPDQKYCARSAGQQTPAHSGLFGQWQQATTMPSEVINGANTCFPINQCTLDTSIEHNDALVDMFKTASNKCGPCNSKADPIGPLLTPAELGPQQFQRQRLWKHVTPCHEIRNNGCSTSLLNMYGLARTHSPTNALATLKRHRTRAQATMPSPTAPACLAMPPPHLTAAFAPQARLGRRAPNLATARAARAASAESLTSPCSPLQTSYGAHPGRSGMGDGPGSTRASGSTPCSGVSLVRQSHSPQPTSGDDASPCGSLRRCSLGALTPVTALERGPAGLQRGVTTLWRQERTDSAVNCLQKQRADRPCVFLPRQRKAALPDSSAVDEAGKTHSSALRSRPAPLPSGLAPDGIPGKHACVTAGACVVACDTPAAARLRLPSEHFQEIILQRLAQAQGEEPGPYMM
eukprot:jgi/Ulvmu1/3605/UM017_0017.1